MSDAFSNFSTGLESPPTNFEAVAPNDNADLPNVTRGLQIGTGGTIYVDGLDGGVDVPLVVQAGQWVGRVKRIYAHDITAADIVAMW